ncbi:hypothetical protein [Okibacterium fritillariae]|uniref:hypothetical protein n=1 Tax=Okibacterium fritillariae TaxID=123320 RepID=UPI001181221D|nr:hypothetical protein [Okibacterium fritillariae]
MAPAVTTTRPAAVTAQAATANAPNVPAARLGVRVSAATVPTVRLATEVAPIGPLNAGATGSDPSDRTAPVEAVSVTNVIRAARDHPIERLGVTAAAVPTMATAGTVLTAEVVVPRVHGARTTAGVTAAGPGVLTLSGAARVAIAPTESVAPRAQVGATDPGHVIVSGANDPTVQARATAVAVSVPSAVEVVTVDATAVRTAPGATGSVPGATVTVSVQRARVVDGTATAVSVPSVVDATGSAPSVRSEGARVAEAGSSAVEIVSRDVTTEAGATMRGVPIVRAMATAMVDEGAMIVVGGKTPCGRATDAPPAVIAMPVPRKKS